MNNFNFLYPVARPTGKKFQHAFNLKVSYNLINDRPNVSSIKMEHGTDELMQLIEIMTVDFSEIHEAAETHYQDMVLRPEQIQSF